MKKSIFLMLFILCLALMFFFTSTVVDATQEKEKEKRIAHSKAYQLYQNKCLSCHASVADPEKPGRTRDDWYLVINIMHEYGLDLTLEEKEIITDLLFDLRKKPAPHY
jgi:hypothetical protein